MNVTEGILVGVVIVSYTVVWLVTVGMFISWASGQWVRHLAASHVRRANKWTTRKLITLGK
jgi:hypothetical protein